MGEIAEMMLEGGLCEGCGEFMGEGDGYPQRCAGCGPGMVYAMPDRPKPTRSPRNVRCQTCFKGFRSIAAMEHHTRDKHGAKR